MRTLRLVCLATLLVSLPFALAAVAADGDAGDAGDPITERQETMKKVGDSMKALSGIARGEAPFDAAVVRQNATAIAESFERAAKLFPAGSDKGAKETWAKAEIWANIADFEAKLQAGHDAAVALQSVTEEAAYRPALGKVGQACRACHDSYRRPKE